MSKASRAAVAKLQNMESFKLGDYDINRDWSYISSPLRGSTKSDYVLYNTKDPSQKIGYKGTDEMFHNFGLKSQDYAPTLEQFGFSSDQTGIRKFFDISTVQDLEEQKRQQELIKQFNAGNMTEAQINAAANQKGNFNDPLISAYNQTYQNTPKGGGGSRGIQSVAVITPDGKTHTVEIGSDAEKKYLAMGGKLGSEADKQKHSEYLKSLNDPQSQNYRDPNAVTAPQAPQPQGFKLLGGNLKEGVRNENVRQLQTLLGGLNADGIFGPKTKAAVIAFQKANGLTPDGIVGPATTAALNKVYGGSSSNVPLPPVGNTGSGVPSGSSSSSGSSPSLPPPSAPAINETYINSLAQSVDTARKSLEDTYKKQLKDLEKKQQEAQKEIDKFTDKQEDVLEDVEDMSQPFREKLENTERERLYINQNFEANQNLTNELGSLLTDGQNLIAQMKGVTGLAGIRNPRINQAIEAVNARVGVIQSVMSARSGQIAEAYRMIDRSVDAINADRKDQLSYYQQLFNFYGSQKADEQNKLSGIEGDKKVYLLSQIKLLEDDLARTQASAETIKEAMTDPDTALAYAEAGVTLNDTPAQIGSKLAKYAYTKEIADMSKEMALKGYTPLIGGAKAPAGAEVVETTDSKGVTKRYYTVDKKSGGSGSGGGGTVTERKATALGSFAQLFESGEPLPDGTPMYGPTGYLTFDAWKAAIAAAKSKGISRADFIKEYGYLLWTGDLTSYGLTPVEQKLITGTLKESEDDGWG